MDLYSAVKAALSTATQALARELRRQRIHMVDARPPHTETGLADRPIDRAAQPLPTGLDPDPVAVRVIDALAAGRRELPATDFNPWFRLVVHAVATWFMVGLIWKIHSVHYPLLHRVSIDRFAACETEHAIRMGRLRSVPSRSTSGQPRAGGL